MFSGLGQVICEKCRADMQLSMVKEIGAGVRDIIFECALCLNTSTFKIEGRRREPDEEGQDAA